MFAPKTLVTFWINRSRVIVLIVCFIKLEMCLANNDARQVGNNATNEF